MNSRISKTAAFYDAARDAVDQYGRRHARMPAFRTKSSLTYSSFSYPRPLPILQSAIARVLTCGAVEGQLPQHATDTWLTLLPFEDIQATTTDETKRELLVKRARFVRLLARLASSPDFPFHAGINCVEDSDEQPAMSFWLRLLRALAPDSQRDASKELERNLTLLSRGGKVRILVSVEMNLRQVGSAQTLEYFFDALASDDITDEAYTSALATCGLTETHGTHPIEIGVEFVHGKVTKAVMTTVLDGIASLTSSPTFRPSFLGFGPQCPWVPSSAVIFGERLEQLALDTVQLGNTENVRPPLFRRTITTAATSVRRLITQDRDFSVSAVMSTLRSSGTRVQELEIEYQPKSQLAEWLAFSIFHVDSDARVSSLCLRLDNDFRWYAKDGLCEEWVNGFKRVLGGVTLPDMGAKQSGTTSLTRTFVRLAPNTTIKFTAYRGSRTTIKVSDEEAATEFEAMDCEGDEVAVVVPGIGVGRASATAICHRRTAPSRLGQDDSTVLRTNHRVTSLTWCVTAQRATSTLHNEHGKFLTELLAIIGQPIRRLALPRMDLTNPQLEMILRHCPNLEELNICHNPQCDLAPILAGHEVKRSKLTSLSMLQHLSAHQDATLVRQVRQSLTKSSPLRLEQLAIHVFFDYSYTSQDHRVQQARLVDMISDLRRKPELQFVEVRLSSYTLQQLPEEHAKSSEASAKFPLRNKLAFLSVLPTKQDKLIGQLDSAVLSFIFAFSASRSTFLATAY